MSDVEKMDNSAMDSQDTYYENSENVNDSQNFQLVDTDEIDVSKNKLETQLETDNLKSKDDCNTQQSKSQEKVADEEVRSKIEEQSENVNDEKENIKEESCKSDNQTDDMDNENDIVHGTPPDMFSSSKKEVHEKIGLKRKKESEDNPATKFLRSSSSEDALSIEKSKFHSNDSQQSDESNDSQPDIPSNCTIPDIIIEETQDVEGEELMEFSEKTSDIISSNKTKDDQNCESCSVQKLLDKNENNANKICEINQNETLNNPITSDTSINETSITTVTTTTTTTTSAITSTTTITTNTSTSDTEKEKTLNVPSTKISDKEELSKSKEVTMIDVTANNDSNPDVSNDSKETKEQESSALPSKEDDKSSTSKNTEDVNLESKSCTNEEIIIDEITINKKQPVTTTYSNNSRMSIEVVFDKSTMPQNKNIRPTLVEIDEEGEKTILDSPEVNCIEKIEEKEVVDTSNTTNNYKSCYDNKTSSDFSYKSIINSKESSTDSKSDKRHFNGSSECKKNDTDGTSSVESDTFNDLHSSVFKNESNLLSLNKEIKGSDALLKKSDHPDIISISDIEHEVSLVDDSSNSKSELNNTSSLTKALKVEREIGVYVRVKCLLHFDESTKEILNKELTSVHCESMAEPFTSRLKFEDNSSSLADISGNENKDNSPGSVNSNPHAYPLITSRLSLLSTASSSSSASSAASLLTKFIAKDPIFSLPRGPAKHAKKTAFESSTKQITDELYEKLTKEWKNNRLLLTAFLNYLNTETNTVDSAHSISNEKIDDGLQKLRCSTPQEILATREEIVIQTATPKSSRKNRAPKRSRLKSNRSGVQTNGDCKIPQKDIISTQESTDTPISKKKIKIDKTDSDTPSNASVLFTKDISHININDELVGKEVFAKWSDNNYYPGVVTDKTKLKYKVNFYDGKNKLLIEDFIIPIPKNLKQGLSVYATTMEDDYGSCGIILEVQTINNNIYYLVETDDGRKVKAQIKNIFLSSDQANVLKEVYAKANSLPITPKISGHITLDNMVDGKRRSKRIATPTISTPKVKIIAGSFVEKNISISEPSVSGISSKTKKRDFSENESKSSDSNLSLKDETLLTGIQPEIVGTPNEQIIKGPQHRIKGKSRNKKKAESEEVITTLGPIPNSSSTLFEGMSFILSCASLEVLDRFQTDTRDSGSEVGTENEEEWVRRPFVRDRLKTQIETAKGKIYEDFDLIPKGEYKNTKLITNVPNITAKNLYCLSVGILAYNHNWIIQCCQKDALLNPSDFILPVGWSLEKESYIENYERPNIKPLNQVMVIIPIIETNKKFATFWRQICENAGAVVLLVDGPESMEGFADGTVVITNRKCPGWAVTKANKWQLPLLSTTWVSQCLIEGKICGFDSHPRYKYNCI